MKQITVKAYELNELSEEARQKAIESMRNINVDDPYWYQVEVWNAQDRLKDLGYENPEVLFSGFGSQGDGACFTGSVDIQKWLKAHKLSNKYRALYNQAECFSYSITHQSRYYYATSTEVEQGFFGDPSIKAQDQAEEVLKLIEDEREELGNSIYKELEDLYFLLLEDQVVIETIEGNEYLFTEAGDRSINI